MTTYLIIGGELPWSAEGIREELGLLDPSFDRTIKAVIASQCISSGCGMHGAVWSVPRDGDLAAFYAKANSIGRLVKIGPAYVSRGVTYHDCEYGVDPTKARKAFRSIINWCWDDIGISEAILRERRGEYRQPLLMAAE